MSGFKHDDGKPDMTFLREFSGALGEVCRVSEYGVRKYKKRGSWPTVANGEQRYAAALLRHELAPGAVDPESGLRHAAHVAWNALARLQLMLDREQLTQARIQHVAQELQRSDWPEC